MTKNKKFNYRINPSGQKELVVKNNQNNQDDETLSEFSKKLDQIIDSMHLGNISPIKDIAGNDLDRDYIRSESFTGTGAIAIMPSGGFTTTKKSDDDDDDDEEDEEDIEENVIRNQTNRHKPIEPLEETMSKNFNNDINRVLSEWEPTFKAGQYDPGDYEMPSPSGNGVADRKLKNDDTGKFDTEMKNNGEAWPRKHNDTPAMCDVDDDGVEHEPQGSHESTHADATDGHQTEVGHDWPDKPKNDGSGVAEPFEGTRWSDGGTLKGSAPTEMSNTGKKQSMPSDGPITGVKGPQSGQPQESWDLGNIGSLMESDSVDLQGLFDLYATGVDFICLEDFQDLVKAHGDTSILNERSLMLLMDRNQEKVFIESQDATGRFWVIRPISESGKPWEDDDDSNDDSNDDSDETCDTVEESRVVNELQMGKDPRRGGRFNPKGNMDFEGDFGLGDNDFGLGDNDYFADENPEMGMDNSEMGMESGTSCAECGGGTHGEASCPECGAEVYTSEFDEPGAGIGAGSDEFESYSPRMHESLGNFLRSAKNIIEQNSSIFAKKSIGEAIQYSWNGYAKGINLKTVPSNVRRSLKKLSKEYPQFNPMSENAGMDKLGGSAISDGSSTNKSSYMSEKGNPGPDLDDLGEPLGASQTNNLDGTPSMKGTEKGMTGSSSTKSVKENISRLAGHFKNKILESAGSVKGCSVQHTILVSDYNGLNRTGVRSSLSESLADIEEILQIHPHTDVVLESFIYKNDELIRKIKTPAISVKRRGPLVSEGKALFRFKRTAENFANGLVSEGKTCRLTSHNWGHAVQSNINYKNATKIFKEHICQ